MRKYVSAVRISIHHGIRMPALRLALDGYLMPHYRFLLGEMLDELSHIEGQLARLEGEFESQMRLFRKPCMPVRKRRPTADMMDLWMGEVGWSGKSPMTHFAIISRATPPASIKKLGPVQTNGVKKAERRLPADVGGSTFRMCDKALLASIQQAGPSRIPVFYSMTRQSRVPAPRASAAARGTVWSLRLLRRGRGSLQFR